MTTAFFRIEAQDYEARHEWDRAANSWQKAIDAYPKELRTGELYREDVARMADRRDECCCMADREEDKQCAETNREDEDV